MVDIQSPSAENRRLKKERTKKKKKVTTVAKYNGLRGLPITIGGHKNNRMMQQLKVGASICHP